MDFLYYTNGMARPRKNPSQRKDVDVRIPMTEDQKRLVAKAAEESDMDLAAWARPILLRAAQKYHAAPSTTERKR
jgi:hypothetical protein